MSEPTTDIATTLEGARVSATDLVKSFSVPQDAAVWSSLVSNDFDSKKNLYGALTNAESLGDHLNQPIELVHFVIQQISLMDENTKQEVDAVRSVLIDKDGNSYAAISTGIVRALQNLMGIFGAPAYWDEPLSVIAYEDRSRNGFRYMSLRLA